MKKIKVAWLFVFCILSIISSLATAAEQHVSVLDINKIMTQSKVAKKIDKELTNKYSARKNKIEKLQQALKSDITALQRDAAIMKASKKEKMTLTIKSKQRDLQREQQDFQQDFSTERNAVLQKLFAKLQNIVNKYADKNEIDLVFQKDMLPFASKRVDITDAVIKQLDLAS